MGGFISSVYSEIFLAKARKRREEARELLADGVDPLKAVAESPVAQETKSASSSSRIQQKRQTRKQRNSCKNRKFLLLIQKLN